MGKKKKKIFVSRIHTFRENGVLKQKTVYNSKEEVAYIIDYDEQGRPLSGICGDFMTWEMVDAHTIKISGNGEMDNFSAYMLPPWYDHEIKTVIVEEGVQTVGDYAFAAESDDSGVIKVVIPESLQSVSDVAFLGCSVEDEILSRFSE